MLPVTDLLLRGTAQEDSPTLVLLHFFGSSRREWIESGLLMASRFRVLSVDTPGFGDAADMPGYSVEEMAQSFAETFRELRLKKIVLVGHSMTGKVAAVLARQGVPGLQKLVLLTPSPVCPEPIAPADRAEMLAQAEPTRADAEGYVRGNSSLPLSPDVLSERWRIACGRTLLPGKRGCSRAAKKTGATGWGCWTCLRW